MRILSALSLKPLEGLCCIDVKKTKDNCRILSLKYLYKLIVKSTSITFIVLVYIALPLMAETMSFDLFTWFFLRKMVAIGT